MDQQIKENNNPPVKPMQLEYAETQQAFAEITNTALRKFPSWVVESILKNLYENVKNFTEQELTAVSEKYYKDMAQWEEKMNSIIETKEAE